MNTTNYKQYLPVLAELVNKNDTLAAPYIAFVVHSLMSVDKLAADTLLKKLVKVYPDNKYVADIIISNMQGREEIFIKEVAAISPGQELAINKQLQGVITDKTNVRTGRDAETLRKKYPKGATLFYFSCKTCHGVEGNGIQSMAPPLNRSEWVNGDKGKLISIVLFGLTGPVKVNNHIYESPEINGDMPAVGFNKDITDDDIAQVLSFIRNSWQNKTDKVTIEDVQKVRLK